MVASLQKQNDELIFLSFSTDLLEKYSCIISDGNSKPGETFFREFTDLQDLEILDLKSINTVKHAHNLEIKRRKQSELLVLHSFGLEYYLKCQSVITKRL